MRIPFIEPYKEVPEEEELFIVESSFTPNEIILLDDDAKVKFIKTVEKLVRCSFEYKEYVEYLVNNVGMNFCSVFNGLNKSLCKNLRIEIHHEPFTLFDIAKVVLAKHMEQRGKISLLNIAEEVMELHFKGRVGLIPLSITVHELVHSGNVFIPLNILDNGFMKFYEDYKFWIDEVLRTLLMKKIELSKLHNNQSNNILKKKVIYLKHPNYDNIPKKLSA